MGFENFGDIIDRLRRKRGNCLYCDDTAITREHALPVAMGGRLDAPMLCEKHKEKLTKTADEPAINNFKPLVMFLAVRRQDGKIGTSFKARTDDGKADPVNPDGGVPGPRLLVKEKASDNRIKRASGSLATLDSLRDRGALVQSGTSHVLAYSEKAPVVNFEVNADASIAGFILKLAFHFVAGFVSDPDSKVVNTIYPSIIGEQQATFKYVSTPSCNKLLFPDCWPPRHEITVFPRGDMTWVTVLLFNAYGYLVKLPFSVGNPTPVRYVQPLLGRPDPQLFSVEPVAEIQWEYRNSPAEIAQWLAEVHKRLDRIQGYCEKRVLRSQCFRAAKAAEVEASKPGDRVGFWGHYRGQLQLEALDPGVIERLVTLGINLKDGDENVWGI